ncbi:lipopolysaccharide biosynthesis protein [Actinophytocola glycyrrhizae]|uniref:Lipopolysaccharide biosynthesis protein n=1 Tax=Actinophytocola glycyrrhizae TaxID=2044873 RepID=A0ABV9S1H8_9PSEU
MLDVLRRFGSAIYMGGGLLLVGAAGYVFVALAGHTLPAADAAALASLYLMVNIVGPGVFSALEQETSRSVSAEAAAGRGPGAVARHAWLLACGLLAALLVLLFAVSPVLTDRAFAGQWGLFVAVLVSVVTSASVYVVRGLLGGLQRFGGYSATLAGEGLARILPCLLIASLATPNATAYALFFASGSAIGALVGLLWLRPRAAAPHTGAVAEPAPPVTARRMARSLSLLVGGTLLMLVVMNVAPVVVTSRLTGDAATAAAFASAFVLARIPLFLFAPVQAMLLPSLTRAAAAGDLATVRSKLRLILMAVLAVGLPAVLASFTIGPWAVQVLFGAEVRLSGVVVGLLGVSTVGLMAALVLQPGLIALGAHRSVTTTWLVGTVVLAVALVLPGDPVRAGVVAQLAGAAVVVALMLRTLSIRLRRGQTGAPPAGAGTTVVTG